MKTMINMFLKELEQEAKTTRKMLALVPEDKYDWKPHEKSMGMKVLATHIAELPGWISMAINTDELDFENNAYAPKTIHNNKELLAYFEELLATAKTDLEKIDDGILPKQWLLRSGKTIYSNSTKGGTIRVALSQTIHHRAQLGVYLRLLNIPIPGSYGPSADDQS
ncbi:MAG TPA: DinB family protein, partial [Bacteroidia bacterium]|nr:DinB family protein [Bacteroidia bacterium]